MPIVLLAGRTRDDRRRATAELETLDPCGRPTFLYLTSSQRKARAVAQSFWDQPDKPATFLPDAFPFSFFLDDLAARFGDGRTPLVGVARALLAGRVFRSVQPELRAWGNLPDSPRVREALGDLAVRWGLAWPRREPPPLSKSPERFHFPAESLAGKQDAGLSDAVRHDAWRFLTAWREALGRSPGWADRPDTLRTLLATLRGQRPAALVRKLASWRTLVVDDLLHLEPLERALLDAFVDAFVATVPDGEVRLCLEAPHLVHEIDGDDGRLRGPNNFFLAAGEPADATLRASRDLRLGWGGRLEAGVADWRVEDAEPDLLDLADHLAGDDALPGPEVAEPVRVRRYGSELQEVRALARHLKAELLAGRSPTSCFVAFPALDRYVPLLRDAFAAYDIPYVLDKGEDLRTSPPVTAVRQLLALADDGIDRDGLRAVLASGWVEWRSAWEAADLDALAADAFPESLADRARLRAAMDEARPRRPRARMDRVHRAVVESGADREFPEQPRAWAAGIARQARARMGREGSTWRWQRLARALIDLVPLQALVGELIALRSETSVDAVAAAFDALLQAGGVDKVAARPAAAGQEDDAEDNRAALRRLAELRRDVVASLLAVQRTVVGEAGAPITLFRDALEQLVREETWRRPHPVEGVQVVGLRDLHGLTVPWLWLGGLVDGEFPRVQLPSFLLPSGSSALARLDPADEDRAILASVLRDLGHGRQRAEARLVISWPTQVAGKESAPSSMLQDLRALRLPGGTLGEHWAASQARDEAALPPILARDELIAQPPLLGPLGSALDLATRRALAGHALLAAARSDPDGFGRLDGVLAVSQPWRGAALYWLRDRLRVADDTLSLSTTALERWARCPMRFFFERVLGAEEVEPFQLEPDRRLEGTLLHDVLERYLGERIQLAAGGAIPRAGLEDLDDEQLRAQARRLLALAHDVARELFGVGPNPWRDQVLAQLTSGLKDGDPFTGRLARFLEQEAAGFLGLDPAAVELALPEFSPAQAAGELDPAGGAAATGDLTVQLRGTVDRVDRGAGRGGARLAVWDYKTGAAQHVRTVDAGTNLQPAVYAAAVQERPRVDGLVTGYRILPEDAEEPRKNLFADPDVLAELKARPAFSRIHSALPLEARAHAAWLRRADWHGQLVGSGVFPPTLADAGTAGCAHCPFSRACRVDFDRAATVGDRFWPAPLAASEHLEEP